MLSDRDLNLSLPHGFAEWASGRQWKAWPYLAHIGREIAQAVGKGDGRIIVNLPPQHGKSLLISKWVPLWFLANFPDKRVILATYEASFAASWGRQARDEARDNERIGLQLRTDASASNSWWIKQGGGMITAGVGGPITGKGGDLLLIDDPVKNWDEARSITYQQRNVDWFNSTFYTRRQPGTTIIVLMTRWHEKDLAGYLLHEHTDTWKHICLPALAEGVDLLGRTEGQALCPERFDVADLDRTRKAVGSQVWAGLYQQRPAALEGGMIKRHWLRYYTRPLDHYSAIVQSWDLSFKETQTGSFVVGQVWGRNGGDFYLLDQIRARMDYPDTKRAIRSLSDKWPLARQKVVESKANGPAILADMRHEMPGLTAFESTDSKEARLSAVSPYFEAGNVYLPDPTQTPWVKDYIEELVTFPNAGNDDQVDATSQALLTLGNATSAWEPLPTNGVGHYQTREVF